MNAKGDDDDEHCKKIGLKINEFHKSTKSTRIFLLKNWLVDFVRSSKRVDHSVLFDVQKTDCNILSFFLLTTLTNLQILKNFLFEEFWVDYVRLLHCTNLSLFLLTTLTNLPILKRISL
jgi:hypothetical protein